MKNITVKISFSERSTHANVRIDVDGKSPFAARGWHTEGRFVKLYHDYLRAILVGKKITIAQVAKLMTAGIKSNYGLKHKKSGR